MLQALLEERFRLKVHRDEKEVPVYFLKVAKGGPRFQPAKKESCVTSDADNPLPLTSAEKPPARICGGIRFYGKRFDMYSATMAGFAAQISQFFDRRLIDRRGSLGCLTSTWIWFLTMPPRRFLTWRELKTQVTRWPG